MSRSPRYFRYRETDSRELCKQGIAIGRSEFRSLALPDRIKESTTTIPGRSPESICGLCFWASMVPHVGVNTIDGYFLISYEGVVPFVHTATRVSIDDAVEISNQTAKAKRLGLADDGL